MPSETELADAYRSWWFGSYKSPPNAAAVVAATHWAQHVLNTYGQAQPQPTDGPV
jgi:hypothetical protein